MTIRWPVRPAPVHGEALSSWLARLTVALHVNVDALFADLAIGRPILTNSPAGGYVSLIWPRCDGSVWPQA
jgi:hypothetical protein